jgi:uncharacterized membrane protein YhaH (DUF805 family)
MGSRRGAGVEATKFQWQTSAGRKKYMHWYFDVLRKYAVFSGRATRQEYWMFCVFNFLIAFVIGLIDGAIGAGFFSGIYVLAILVPSLAVGVRRLHDVGRSGWWMLIGLIPLLGGIVLFIFSVQDGQPGSNQYGPDPRGRTAVDYVSRTPGIGGAPAITPPAITPGSTVSDK